MLYLLNGETRRMAARCLWVAKIRHFVVFFQVCCGFAYNVGLIRSGSGSNGGRVDRDGVVLTIESF